MSKKLLPYLSCFLLFFAPVYPALSQNREITGKVIDSITATPVPGVTVRVSGTQVGTSTDANGSFKITGPASGGTLIFSSINYATQTVPLTDGDNLLIRLAPAAQELTGVEV